MRFLPVFCLSFLLAACVSTQDVDRPAQVSQRLDTAAVAYVSVPPDGHFGKTVYANSGMMAANAVAKAFQAHLQNVYVASAPATIDDALQAARGAGARYLISPVILHWEEHATQWSWRSDRVRIKLTVIDTMSGNIVETAVLKGTSGAAAFFVRREPQQLLAPPLDQYVESLFPEKSGYPVGIATLR